MDYNNLHIAKDILHKLDITIAKIITKGQSEKIKLIVKYKGKYFYLTFQETQNASVNDPMLLCEQIFEYPILRHIYYFSSHTIVLYDLIPENYERLDIFFSKCNNNEIKKSILQVVIDKLILSHKRSLFFTENYIFPKIDNLNSDYQCFFEYLCANIKYIKIPQAIVHGDFHLKNIYINSAKDSILLTDFELLKDYVCILIDYVKLETSLLIHLYDVYSINFFEKNIYSNYLDLDTFLSVPNELVRIVRISCFNFLSHNNYNYNYTQIHKLYLTHLYYYFSRFVTNSKNSVKNKIFVRDIIDRIEQISYVTL